MLTYTIRIVDIRPNLARFPLFRGCFRLNHSVRRDEPVPGTYSIAIIVGDVEFEGSYARELWLLAVWSMVECIAW